MPSLVKQSVTMPASAKELFDMYLSARAHAAITGQPVTIGRKPGAKFSAFGGALSGTMIATVPNRLIVRKRLNFDLPRPTRFRLTEVDSSGDA
jgi:hypothetical protein